MYKSDNSNSEFIYGLKLIDSDLFDKISIKNLEKILQNPEVTEYFSFIYGLQLNNYRKYISLMLPLISEKIKILNLSHNNLRGASFLKDHKKFQ